MKSINLEQGMIYGGLLNMYLGDIRTMQNMMRGRKASGKVFRFLDNLIKLKKGIIQTLPNGHKELMELPSNGFTGSQELGNNEKKEKEKDFLFLKRTFLQLEKSQKQLIKRLISNANPSELDSTLLKKLLKKHQEMMAWILKDR